MPKLKAFALDVGAVLASWIVLLALENLVVGLGYRAQFVGTWEMAEARRYLSPIALAAAAPLAAALVFVARLVRARRAAAVLALGAAFGLAVGLGVSTGRHFESATTRAPFVLAVAAASGAMALVAARRAPVDRPRLLAVAGALVAAGAWLADAFVLPRLYPAFHAALLVVALGAWSLLAVAFARTRAGRYASAGALALTGASAAWAWHAAHAVARADNLRRVLVEHAPVLGPAVLVAAKLAPPEPLEADEAGAAAVLHLAGGERALDWTGHDVVLVTIDALRADHVSSYGYRRKTTPNIDALAARGARFSHAYCATPHTSYSIASLMTGRYMRPLLAMGAGDDVETWAGYMRRYGFRTGGFYPPAVFFIDAHRFRHLHESGLGFEYKKEEFAGPALRREQVATYLAGVGPDQPAFVWLHAFQPHEPYVAHPEHPFPGGDPVAAYDSEIAEADALVGDVVRMVEQRGRDPVVIVTADHGEEFGDHGGRYHGTSVYEEQVRVPLVVVGPGVVPRVVGRPVQTIDLLPTALAALDIPRPARVRGRDLGAVLAGRAGQDPQGLAFAETDEYTLVARGDDRLVCARKIASCTLFDVARDPGEQRAVADEPARVEELRGLTAAIERENGKLEASELPEALRRGLQGDRDAAVEVAALLDDVRVDIRRAAARCAFELRAAEIAPQLARAEARDEDREVRRWSALALSRLAVARDAGADDGVARAGPVLTDPDPRLRAAAALVLAEHGDARGEGELVARLKAAFVPGAAEHGELDEARELFAALGRIRARTAVPALVSMLGDVRLRPYVVDALGEIGDVRAKAPLLEAFAGERYVHVRPKEARALLQLGARAELVAPLARFAGVPEPMRGAIALAREAGALVPARGGLTRDGAPTVEVRVRAPEGEGPARLYVLTSSGADGAAVADAGGPPTASVEGERITLSRLAEVEGTGEVAWVGEVAPPTEAWVPLSLASSAGVSAAWLVRRAPEVPPPAPRAWDAGPENPL